MLLLFTPPARAEDSAPSPTYAYQLSYADAESAVASALVEKGAGSKIAATISGHNGEPLFSYTAPIAVELRGLQFDKQNGHWSASLLFTADGQTVTAMPVAGHYDEVISVPVLKRQLRNGDVISEADIEMRDFPLLRTRSDTITDPAKLIGLMPARSITPLRPIREHEIAALTIVKKNALVQMRYQSPGITISTDGQAMNDGGKGEVIAVRNMNSHKIVRAVIVDENTVLVGANMAPRPVAAPADAAPTPIQPLLGGTPHEN